MAKVIEGGFNSPPGLARLVDDDRPGVRNQLVVAGPDAAGIGDGGGAREQAALAWRLGVEDLQLDAPLGAGGGIERAGGHQFASGHEIGGEADFDDRRSTDAEAGGIDGAAVWMTPEQRRSGPHGAASSGAEEASGGEAAAPVPRDRQKSSGHEARRVGGKARRPGCPSRREGR